MLHTIKRSFKDSCISEEIFTSAIISLTEQFRKVKIVVKYTVLDNSRFESNDKLGRVTTNSKDPYLHSELALVSS